MGEELTLRSTYSIPGSVANTSQALLDLGQH